MSKAATPKERAAAIVSARSRVPGGPWFIELKGAGKPPILLGPYVNPAIAREQADKIKELLAALLEASGAEQGEAPGR